MSEARYGSVDEDAAAKTTGDGELEAAAQRMRNDAEGVEEDETEAYSFPPEMDEK